MAAGRSSRMKTFKPLLPLGETTILERAIRLFQRNGVSDIRVVIGHRGSELKPLLTKLNVKWCMNAKHASGMLSSVKCGLKDLQFHHDAFFILPADIPLVRRQTIVDLLSAFQTGAKRILYPLFQNKRGHPPLIDREYAPEIISWAGKGGLRSFLGQYEINSRNIPVADQYIHLDADTPQDYHRLLTFYDRYDIPTVAECKTLLVKKFGTKRNIVAHCREVARLSCFMGRALRDTESPVDSDLIVAAGLLHDLARDQSDHAAVGTAMLRDMDYPAVADVVETHMDIRVPDEGLFSSREILYLADKLVDGDQIISLENKFKDKMSRYEGNSNAQEAITQRFANAVKIRERFEAAVGKPLDTILESYLIEGGDDIFDAAWGD